jgi:hypothetical protein
MVESADFIFFRYAQANRVLDDLEYDEHRNRYERRNRENTDDLCAEERKPAVVEDPPSTAKKPTRIVPAAPATPCTEMAPTGSSIFATLSKNSTPRGRMMRQ